MRMDYEIYRKKLEGCWLGKSVGGTLGGPYEGKPGPLELSYYDPVPTEMLPNDDLDLQVVWLETVRRCGLPVNRWDLAQAWLEHVHLWPDEYGIATRNLVRGVFPPASGAFDNPFTAGMGAAIRTELWACLAPGDPELAARLATEDACVDHAGEGLYAARFLAALESCAFVEDSLEKLMERARSFIPADSRLARALRDTETWWAEVHDWRTVRDRIVAHHAPQNWTDVVPNLSFILLGWLAGGGEFGPSICTAVNCGFDTDCTGATLGALLGILQPKGIEQKWLDPIGRSLVLSPGMVGMHQAATLDELSDQVAETAIQLLRSYDSTVELDGDGQPPQTLPHFADHADLPAPALEAGTPPEALLSVRPLIVRLHYSDGLPFHPSAPKRLSLAVHNPTTNHVAGGATLRGPDGWIVEPRRLSLDLAPGDSEELPVTVTAPERFATRVYRNMLDIQLEANGLAWRVSGGLPQTIPWVRYGDTTCETGEIVESEAHFQNVAGGPWRYETDMKMPYRGTFMFVTQGTRPMRTYLDEELINDYDGSYYVPAMHRNRTGSEHFVDRGWHRLRIEVADGEPGELFFDVGLKTSMGWVTDLEWRLPR